MPELIRQASAIAARHRSALITAVEAELEILSLGFDSVKFDKMGVSEARFLNIWYPLKETK